MKVKRGKPRDFGHEFERKRLVEMPQDEVDGAVDLRHIGEGMIRRTFFRFSQDLSKAPARELLQKCPLENGNSPAALAASPRGPVAIHPMKYLLPLCFAACIPGLASAASSAGAPKTLDGYWKPVTAVLSGAPMSDALLDSISLKMAAGRYEVYVGDEPDRGTYVLDPLSDPKGMIITGTEGPNHGRTFPAIYELDGDTLRICYDLSGAKRPEKFESVAGTRLYLVTYRRRNE